MINYKKRNLKTLITAIIAVTITILIVVYSEDAFQAALEGLKVWWEIVFPSLLPFFIIAEILMGLGVVHFLGTLLEPLMKPLFKVPGVGAFAMAMGLASGYPIGAKITANLRKKNLCSKTEGERLLCFTNTADPLFLVGAVSVGMLHSPKLGIIIAASHYISSFSIGFIMRFYKGKSENKNKELFNKRYNKNILRRAYEELLTARKNDGRGLGELFGDSVQESISTLLLVGGFIILFSVITKIIIVTGVINIIANTVNIILLTIGLSTASLTPLVSGFFEITNGANLASQIQAPLIEKLVIINAIIAWSGLSVHSQVATMINGTDLSIKPYIWARIIQSIIAGFVTIFLIKFNFGISQTTFSPIFNNLHSTKDYVLLTPLVIISIIIILLIISFTIHFFKKIQIIFFHYHN